MIFRKVGVLLFCLCLGYQVMAQNKTVAFQPFSATLTLACASNFTLPIRDMVAEFQRLHPAIKIQISSASSGKLYAQIVHGAPFDVFLSADQDKPKRLVEQGLAIPSSLTTYATGTLYLWSPSAPVDNLIARLQSAKRIALANPTLAPYGAASEQVMSKLGLASSNSKWILGENIAQAFQFIHTGHAPVGWIAASQRLNTMKPEHLWAVPSDLHDPIHQDAVVLSRTRHVDTAQRFLNFMRSAQGLAIMARYGYH